MAVFKATQNRSNSATKFKATEKRSYDSALVSQWESRSKESLDTLEKYRQRINSGGFLSADDLTTYRSALDIYKENASNLRRISKSLGQGVVEDDDQWGKSLAQMEYNFKGISDYYSQWKTEVDYKVAMDQANANAQRMAELTGGYDPVKNQQEGKAGWDAYVAQQEKYAQMNKEAVSAQEDPAWWEQLLKYIGDIGSDTSLPGLGGSQVVAMSKEAQQKDSRMRSPDERWTDEQRETFGYLWNTERQKASEYAFAVNSMLDKQAEDAKIAEIAGTANDSFLSGTVNTLGALATAPFGLADYLGDLISQGAVGYVPQADGEITPFEYSQAVTGGISQNLNDRFGTLNENIPVIGGKGWGDAYGLGTSIAQSSLAAFTGGSGQALVQFFGSAAASGVDDAVSRGASGEQAVAYGTMQGLAEGLAEMIGVDNLMNIGSANTMRQLVGNLLKQGAAEGLEEGITSVLNNFADNLVLRDKSNFNALVDRHMKSGMSESDAKKQAWLDIAEGVAFDMLGGFVSGGIHAAPVTTYQTVTQNEQAKKLYGGSQQEFVGEALEIDPNNAFAQKMQGRLAKGKNLSGGQLNQLVQQNNTAITAQDMTSIHSAAENRLVELGETGNVSAVAAALAKQAAGEKLSRAEQQAIANSKYGQRVANELSPENIKSGGYASAWAEKIDTNRINAQEYSRLVEDAQLPDDAAENTAEQVAAEAPKAAQAVTAQPVEAAEAPVATGQESLQVAEESSETPEVAEEPVTLEEASRKYGAQAGAMVHTYTAGQDVAAYDKAYKVAYDMGKSGVSLDYVKKSQSVSYLTETQRELAYEAGKAASSTEAQSHADKNKADANGKTGRKKGVVRGEGVKIADLKKTFNDPQGKAYKFLSTVAEVTGIDIVLYKSEAGPDGKFAGAQGKYSRSEPGTIYIDLNAGLTSIDSAEELAKYSMLRTFSHEFTHFIENWNPVQYNEFRKVVFDTLTQRGENVHDLIETKQAQNPGMEYEAASREVVAEAMTDILPDANFVQELAQKHKNIFAKLLEKLKEFAANLREYFDSIGHNSSKEANALKEQMGETVKYVDSIVQLFDKVAVEAVENYQQTVATEEAVKEFNGYEGKEETREAFYRRAHEKAYTVRERGKIAYGYNPVTVQTGSAGRTEENLKKLGIQVIVHDGLEANVNGLTIVIRGEATAVVGDVVYVRNSMETDPLETAGHEAYHFWKQTDARVAYEEVVADNIMFASDAFVQFQQKIEDVYFGKEVGIEDDGTDKLVEEIFAYITGIIHAGDSDNTVHQFLRDYDAVKAAWDNLVKKQTGVTEEVVVAENATVEKDDHGFTISDNVERGSLEITFDSKPSEAVRNVLKENKFRWNGKKGVWYGFGERQAIADALRTAYDAETKPDEAATEVPETAVSQTAIEAYDPNDPYNRLANLMGGRARFEHEGIIYRVLKDGPDNSMWRGHIDQADVSLSGVYVTNASGLHYTSELYKNRDDARDDIIAVARASKLLEEKTTETTNHVEEAIENGENADNQGAVQQPVTDGSGAAPVLDELQTEDVQGNGGGGDTVGNPAERGQETGRDGNQSDSQRSGSGSGSGSGQSGDLRGTDRVTEDVTDNNVGDKLHEEVVEQIQQQSTEQPKGRNFVIGDSLDLPSGEKARYKANVEAIRLVKKLQAEGRYATEAEQTILSKYVGWGGLANAFDQRKADWSKEFAELKELLTDEEYSSARGSTLNAHYTDISVIKAMYDGLKQLGFTGGRMMEPSSGVGNFVGAMPADMSSKVKSWTMVELDGITGLIAKYLYPNADVRIQGFEKANIPNNFMDVAISNVPFGNYAIADKSYPKKVTGAIHNYFFAKSLDKVRPGGIVMFITSSYTMNSKDSTVRRYIMQKADLLGAIRLPDSAFKGNAGTEVVTDILILKKRADNTDYAGEDFLEAPYKYISGYNGAYINTYFENHPEMVLGTASMEGGMYRGDNLTYKAFTDRGSLADQIRAAFQNIKGKMDYPAQRSPEKTNFAVERAVKKAKSGRLVVKEGKVYQSQNGELVEIKVPKGAAERISGMQGIRDAARDLMNAQQQGQKESEIKKARQKLNKLYDTFVKQYGYLNAPANRNNIMSDPDRYSILALENWNPEKKTAVKSDLFSKNTIAPNRTVTSAKDTAEGLIVSVNQTGGVDVALIAKLTGKTEADVTRELIDSRKVFKNRDGELETAEAYLSGNVRAKLRDAEALVPLDADYQKNVEALKAVVPADVGYEEIFVNPGTPWIPDTVYSDFAAHMLGTANTEWNKAVDVSRNPDTGNFTVELKNRYLKTNSYNTQKWGTSRRNFLDLFDAMLNSKSVVVKYKTDDGKSVVDQDATAAANEKVEAIQKEFQEWLWKDENRRTELATLYNETFNSIVTPKYNGDNLTVNGANAMKPLRPHQRNAVQRVISSGGNTLLAHKVGAGKTYEMAAAAMKLKQLGLVKKPLFAVPKALVAQWGNEFIDFFPTAKLLVAEASDFTTANRKIFANRIANGEYDAVIVSYEQFERLPISAEFARDLYQEQIDSIIRAIEEAKAEKGGKSLSVKDLEKKRKSLQAKIDKLSDSAKDDDNIEFEQLGVDSIFVDEAHNFKNLFYTTSMTNVSGLGNKDGSKRAFDLYTKVRYLQKLNGGRGIVFATATPVMNSMSEMYIMQKYLQPDLLDQLGLSTFDAWAKQFGEVVNGVEIKPSGQGYRVKQSFSRFKNMSELQLLFRNFADVLTDIPGLKIPKMKGGKVNVVVCEPGQFQQDYMKELEKRADNIKNVDPSVDNMLKITSDGRKISYTQRMIDPSLPYEEGCKIYRCADNVVSVYKDSTPNKGTQLIFCDMATPKGKSKAADTQTEEIETDMESAKLYDDIKARLMKGGIPAKEIAFIHEADTDQKKKKLFADVNDGKVRVLIGSTGKMGVGMNAQKRIVAIHHLDAPWRPGDVEQRNGRAFRQGNINDEVENFTYVTEGSFDARLWDILERKQNFINQVMNGENVGRETEDTGEVTLSAAEVKALASGSPLIMEQVQLDTDIKKLESLYRAHRSAIVNAMGRLEADKGRIAVLEKMIANGKADVAARVDTYSEGKFSITIGKQKFTDKKEAGIALMAEATAKASEDGYTTIAKFAGFDLRVVNTHEGIKGLISGQQTYYFNTYSSNTTYMINHLISRVDGISDEVNEWEQELAQTRKDMEEQAQLITQPFAKQAELEQKRSRYNEIMEILNPKEEQALEIMDEEAVQEQSREYLQEDEQFQQRTNTLTDREVLALAADQVKVDDLTDAEKHALDVFQQRLSKLDSLQAQRTDLGQLYKEQQFGAKVDRAEAAKTLNRMRILDSQIQKASAEVLSVEEKTVLKRVLQKARKVVEQQERQHGQEILNRWRDRRDNAAAIKKYRDRIRGDVDELTNWVLHPDNKSVVKHIPDALKSTVIPFLSSINFMSKRQLKGGNATVADKAFMEQLRRLEKVMQNTADVDEMYSNYTDLPPDFMKNLHGFMDTAQGIVDNSNGEFVINQMTAAELQELSKVVRTLKKYIMQMNRFHVNAMFQHVYEAGDNSIDFLGQLKPAENTGTVSQFLLWQQMRPAYAFERFGEGGKAIYDGLRRGQATLAFNTKTIKAFSDKAYSAAEVKAWENEVKTIRIGPGKTVTMRVSQIMSLYELNKREQARGHILGEGIRVATFKNGKQKISDVGQRLTPGELNMILRELTPRQKEVADNLQQFMQKQGGEWGNHVTVARFGEQQFGEENYFPINSDGRHLQVDADEKPGAAALYALLNMGFTKQTQEKAKNRIIVYSIFDVFANHMASMAQYNAFALPVVDALKWFNYQQVFVDENGSKTILGSVREQMDRAYGVPEENRPGSGRRGYAQNFVINIIKAFNGTEAQGTPNDTLGLQTLHHYNRAQVAYNFRVVVQQPLAITRAAILLDYASILKGLKLSPSAIQKNIQEMQTHSGIAAWKSLGFYDVNISRGLTSVIKHDDTALDKISDLGMWAAEKADTMTWAAIWSASKEEVIRKQKLKPDSEGFYDAVTKLFEDVIYKTQVVDSVLTKNEFMRDKGFFARAIGSFMSEPSATASMLVDAYDKYHMDMQRGMTRQQAWKENSHKIVRTVYVYGLGAAILAAVQAVADALRDDDDYQDWYEKWLEAFGGNLVDELMPFNKVPIASDFYDLAKELLSIVGVDTYGSPPQSVFMQWYDSLVKGTEILYDKISGANTNYTWYGGAYKLLQALSGMTGLPMAAVTREIITAWNNIVGGMAPSLKVKTYEASEKSQIKYAYQDGYLTEEEAIEQLVKQGIAKTEQAARKIVREW